jgi:hypothetical protein
MILEVESGLGLADGHRSRSDPAAMSAIPVAATFLKPALRTAA